MKAGVCLTLRAKLVQTLRSRACCPVCGVWGEPYAGRAGRAVGFYFPPWTCGHCGARLRWNVYRLTLPLTMAAMLILLGVIAGVTVRWMPGLMISAVVLFCGLMVFARRSNVTCIETAEAIAADQPAIAADREEG